ncbi:MAG: hypothetical protein ACFB16_05425, partial [Phormidesmis sp.]
MKPQPLQPSSKTAQSALSAAKGVSLTAIAQQTQKAARQLAQLPSATKNKIIESDEQSLETAADDITTANQQ